MRTPEEIEADRQAAIRLKRAAHSRRVALEQFAKGRRAQRFKTSHKPKPVTLPKVSILEKTDV